MHLRLAVTTDAGAVAQLFHDAIRALSAADYSREQIEAWAGAPEAARWRDRIDDQSHEFWVAELDEALAGFCEFEPDGHVDTLYVSPDHARRGVATALLRRVHESAARLGLARLYTEASITARPMFERHGFRVIAPQNVAIRGTTLRNYQMEKPLQPEG
jgi:putative acetyltransferase